MFSKILIANRGEIAVRIIKTCRRMGIATVVVYSEADADSLAVEMADESVFIGPAPAAQSYLLADKIVAACQGDGRRGRPPWIRLPFRAGGLRPAACRTKGIAFIGPNVHAIEAMGDKIQSKLFAAKAGVSTVPGHVGEIERHRPRREDRRGDRLPGDDQGLGRGRRQGHPRRLFSGAEVEEGFPSVKAEAKGAFGDDRTFIEKFIESPRHIEIQVLGDKHGHVVHLFERECSIQRRNQKVIEEAPVSASGSRRRGRPWAPRPSPWPRR